MVIFHSYVNLPEGNDHFRRVSPRATAAYFLRYCIRTDLLECLNLGGEQNAQAATIGIE